MTLSNRKTDATDFLCDYADVLRNCSQYNKSLELLDKAKALLPDDRRDLKARILRNDRWCSKLYFNMGKLLKIIC